MLSSDDYLRVQRLVDAGEKVVMEADVKTKFFDKDIKGYNVIAEILGTDPKLKSDLSSPAVQAAAFQEKW